MNCTRNLFTLGAAFVLALSPVLNAEEATGKGVNYLVGQQAEDGSWSSEDKLRLTDSSESFQALRRTQGGENALNKSLQFFSALTEENNETLAIKLIALSNTTANIDIYVNKLIADQKSDGGWGIVDSKIGSIPHTIMAVNALLASGKANSEVLSKACSFLASVQKDTGAWIFSGEHSLSDVAHTAMTLLTLKKVQSSGSFSSNELEKAITKARSYLEGENNNGSYGDILDTAWVYLAFSQIKQPSELQATLTLIQNSQLANGSWNNKVYDTAVCLQALTAIQIPQTDLPDLEITETNISFNPTNPLTGNEVTVTAVIFNKGELDAENVKVEFFNRDPRLNGVEIATSKTIPLVPAGGSVSVNSSFLSTGLVGAQQIVVFVDRNNDIREVTKANNAAAKILAVGGMPDLSIAAGDITLSNPNPKAFETVDLIITIHNIGNEAVQNIPVKIFDNDKLLNEFILSGVNAESSNKAIITTGFSAENHVIRVEVDPDHTVTSEINLANNTASTSFTVEKEAEKPLDIAVESIVFDPAVPLSTGPTKVTVTIANLGGIDATTAFNTTLSVDGSAIGSISVPQLLGGQKAVLSFENITLAAGERTITAVADSGNVVTADTNRANNTMSTTITVRDSSTPVDIELISITATPTTATTGSTVLFKVMLKNNGTTNADNVEVKLFNGTTSISSAKIPKLLGGQSSELQFEYAFSVNGSYTIKAVADPDNKITESNKANNEKSMTMTVAGASDLEITSTGIVFSVEQPEAFEQFTITAIVKNIGNMDAVNVPVRFLANGEVLTTMNLAGVSAGSNNKAILTTSLPKGSYNVTIQIDPEKTLSSEHNLINNTAYRTIEVKAPTSTGADIAIESLTFTPALPIQGTPVNVIATIVNLGGTDITTPFAVEFKNGDAVLHSFTVSSLAAGQKASLNLAANLNAGEYTISVVADSANAITETSKANNTASKTISVKSSATPADLATTVTIDKAAPNVMDKVTLTATITNAGTTTASNFYVRILVNGEVFGSDYKVASLAGGSSFNLQIPYTVSKEGANIVQVTADVLNTVTESDKTNNTGTLNFNAISVPLPDLTIGNGGIVFDPAVPQPSTPFTLKLTVSNIGTADAAACKVLVTENHPQMAGAVKLGEVAVPAIAAGAKATVSVTLNFAATNENVYIFVDSDDVIIEANESNNLFKTTVTVQALPDLMVDASSLTVSHTDLEKSQFVKLTGIVSNVGSVAASASKLRLLVGEGANAVQVAVIDIPALATGGSYEFETLWSPGRGASKITAQVDYENSIIESSKENNTAEKTFNFTMPNSEINLYRVEQGGDFMTLEYKAGQVQKIKITHSYTDAIIYYNVYNPAGERVATSFDRELASEFSWDTGANAPSAEGEYYTVSAVIHTKSGGVMEELKKTFKILPSTTIIFAQPNANPNSVISARSTSVTLSAAVMFTTNIDNTFTVRLKVTTPGGEELLQETQTIEITQLSAQKTVEFQSLTNSFTEAGDYQLLLEVLQDNEVLYSKTGKITSRPEIRVKVTKTITPEVLPSGPEGQVKVEIKLQGTRE